jgi:drug/metabolite transporter (DMT)-like permease
MTFFYIIGCLVFTVLGQLLVKKGAIELQGETSPITYAINPWVILGLSSAVIAAASWIKALQHYRLNYAYPFMSISFLAVALLSGLVFGEESKPQQWIGLSIVLVGLYVGSR